MLNEFGAGSMHDTEHRCWVQASVVRLAAMRATGSAAEQHL